MRPPAPMRRLAPALVLFAVLCPRDAQGGVRIVVVHADPPGTGFNDPTPKAPVGGNTGTTLGEQRLIAVRAAAELWASRLESTVDIQVNASFVPLDCDSTKAVLGIAGPTKTVHDFSGAPLKATLYPISLANSLAGRDLDPTLGPHAQVEAHFNGAIGVNCDFPRDWYYGLDGNASESELDLVTIATHELVHGLGFLTFVNLSTGAKGLGYDDPFMVQLFDQSLGLPWPSLTDAQRLASETNTGNLLWLGAKTTAAAVGYTAGTTPGGVLKMYAPNPFESGSSVAHWDRSLTPAELLQPSYTAPLHDAPLASKALQDLGWRAPAAAPTAMYLLPSSAHSSGVGGSFFTTDLTIRSSAAIDGTFTLKFLAHDGDGRSGPEKTFALAPGRSVTYTDVLASVFGIGSNDFGAILITSTVPLTALGQTSTPGAGGTFGQSVPVFSAEDMVTPAAAKTIIAVREDGSARTNLILASSASVSSVVDVRLVSNAGVTLGTKRYSLPPLGMTQVSRVVRDMGVGSSVSGAALLLSTPTPGGSFAAYASVIDAGTNDPRTLLPR